MKSILISIKPKWCEKICHEIGKDGNGKPIYEKRIEVRKTAPKEVPFKVYIYCTKTKNKWSLCDYEGAYQNSKGEIVYAQQHIIGEFICDKVMFLTPLGLRGFEMREEILKLICLTNDDLNAYGGLKTLYGWHISDLKIYDRPRELSEFFKPCPTKEKGDCLSCDCLADNDYGGVCTNNLTRPPRSWMYVEEIETR